MAISKLHATFIVGAFTLLAACGGATTSSVRDASTGKNGMLPATVTGVATQFPGAPGGSTSNLLGVLGTSCGGSTCIAWGNRSGMINNGDGTYTVKTRPTLYSKVNGVWTESIPQNAYYGANDDRNLAYSYNGGCGSDGKCIIHGMRVGAVFCSDIATCPATPDNGAWMADYYTYSPSVGFSAGPLPVPATSLSNADPNSGLYFMSTSCATTTCYSVGRYFTANPRIEASVVASISTTGTGLTLTQIALPAGTQLKNSGTQRISCSSSGHCVVAGLLTNNAVFIAQRINGAWSAATTINLPGNTAADSNTTFSDVSCAPDGSCEVAGSYTPMGGKYFSAHIDSNGAVSTAAQIMLPAGDTVNHGTINAVRCPASGSCVAVGSVTYNTPCKAWFHGSTWTLITTTCSMDRGFAVNQVNGVWQTAVTVPEPGAQYSDTTLLDGSTLTNPNTSPSTNNFTPVSGKNYLTSLDCASATTCIAGGYYFNAIANTYSNRGNGVTQLVFDNNTWQAPTAMTMPTGNVDNWGSIAGLSCVGSTECMVAGQNDQALHNYIVSLTVTSGASVPDQPSTTTTVVNNSSNSTTSTTVATTPAQSGSPAADANATVINPAPALPTQQSTSTGSASGTTSGSTAGSSTNVSTVSQLKVGKSLTPTAVAAIAKAYVAKGSKVSMIVASASKLMCKISGTKLTAMKVGSCSVSVSVAPATGRATKSTAIISVVK